jgi:hypothetical protein
MNKYLDIIAGIGIPVLAVPIRMIKALHLEPLIDWGALGEVMPVLAALTGVLLVYQLIERFKVYLLFLVLGVLVFLACAQLYNIWSSNLPTAAEIPQYQTSCYVIFALTYFAYGFAVAALYKTALSLGK